MSWQYVDINEVYEIHQAIAKRAGSKAGVRDFGLLHSAIERPKATYFGEDLYPNIFLKAAALLQSLCMNHPFTDVNKRTAWLSTKRFLAINKHLLKSNKLDAADFMVYVDNSQPEIKEIATWLKEHSQPLPKS